MTETGVITTPTIGQRVIAVTVPGVARCDGMETTITRITDVAIDPNRQRMYGMFTDPNLGSEEEYYFFDWKPVDGETLTVSSPDGREAVLQQQINTLTIELERANTRFTLRDTQFRDSIKTISDRLNEEARIRGWCEEFNRIINETNDLLPVYELEGGEREFEVTWTETYLVTVYRSVAYTAVDEDSARDMAQNEETCDSYSLKEAIGEGNYEFHDSDGYEVSEA